MSIGRASATALKQFIFNSSLKDKQTKIPTTEIFTIQNKKRGVGRKERKREN